MYPLRKMAAALICFGAANFVAAAEDTDSVVTAVFSRSFNNYERPARPDGSDKLLTYVIAKGGAEPGANADESMSDVKFAGVVRVLGRYLAKQAYFPAKDGKKADLMLVVHWGKTTPYHDDTYQRGVDQGLQKFQTFQQLRKLGIGASPGIDFAREKEARRTDPVRDALDEAAREETVQGMTEVRFAQDARIEANRSTANLLGYTAELTSRDNPSLYGGAGTAYYDLIEDLESERYYVSVTAYDFQQALQHNQKKTLWRTVASIDARGNRFDERLMAMVERASRYFGRDSGRLIRQFEYTPHINLGDLKMLGVVENGPTHKR
ncbi:MAG: hypothetical protein ABIZ04_15975 [Opitutus sp.]